MIYTTYYDIMYLQFKFYLKICDDDDFYIMVPIISTVNFFLYNLAFLSWQITLGTTYNN